MAFRAAWGSSDDHLALRAPGSGSGMTIGPSFRHKDVSDVVPRSRCAVPGCPTMTPREVCRYHAKGPHHVCGYPAEYRRGAWMEGLSRHVCPVDRLDRQSRHVRKWTPQYRAAYNREWRRRKGTAA
jgi:hypothetical protein